MAENNETTIAIFGEKIDKIIEDLNEIKTKVCRYDEHIHNIETKLLVLEEKNINKQKEINEIKTNSDNLKRWLFGMGGTVIGGLLLAILKFGFGL